MFGKADVVFICSSIGKVGETSSFGFLNMPDAKEPEIVVGMGFRCRELVTNPHAWLYIDGKDTSGKAVSWGFEGRPGGLVSRGWKKGDLTKGDHITVEGYRAKDNSNIANARTVTLPDGRKLFGGFKETPGNLFK